MNLRNRVAWLHILLTSATSLIADELTTWPSQYTIRPWEASRLTAADVVGPDGIVYPDFTGVGVTGGIPNINNSGIRAGYTVFNVTTYGANGADTISDNLNVAAAATAARSFLNANPANKAILYFPAGTYYLSAPVVFALGNIVIDGDGPTSTFIKLQTEVGQTGALFTIKRDPAFAGYLTATTLVPRGGNTLTLNSDPATNGFSVGSWVRLAPSVSGAGTSVSDRYSNPDNHVVFNDASYHLGRILFAKITALNSTAKTVTLDRTFTHDYFVNESPQLRRVSLAENCGIQDLTIETMDAAATIDPINFEYTANSWIKNIKTVKAKSWPYTVNTSTRFEVRDSQFLGTWIDLQQGGGVAYLGWSTFITDALMENCQAGDLRHMAIFQASNRSVIRGCTFTGKSVQSPQLHGRFPHENLVEDSTFDTRTADGSGSTRGITAFGSDQANSLVHGANGPRNVFYNNRVLSGMGSSDFGGTSEGFIFAYNRILKTDDIEALPAIMAMDRTFDFVVRGNIFQAIGSLPAITLTEGTCTGWNITDNQFYGTNGYLYEGDSTPAITSNNRFYSTATSPAAATTPEASSIYSWQKSNAATARLVLASDRRIVSDTGGTTDITVVRIKSSTASALTVNLSASPAGLTVPATVTIPAGETAATFSVTGTNVSGEQLITLTASASGLLADSEKISVLDQDLAQPNFGTEKWPVPPVGMPSGWKAGNYGQVTVPGTQSYTVGADTWAITGGGLKTETFHGSLARSGRRFVYRTIDGDGEIRARITAASGEQQVGLMIADDEAALTDFIWVEPNGRVCSSSNDAQNGLGNGVPTERASAGTRIVPSWLRLKRTGSVFTAYRSTVTNPTSESDWTMLATVDFYLNPSTDYKSPALLDQRMHYGFFINSGSTTVAASASFTGTQFTGALVGTSPPPAAPTGLTASLIGNTQANLTWTDNANDETGYAIDVRVGSSSTWSPLITVAADTTAYSHTGLLDGVTYAYRVRAVRSSDNAASANTPSSSVSTTLSSLPIAPTNPAALGLFTTQIQFTWSDLSHNETGYQIERSTSPSSGFTLLTTLGAGAVGYIDSNLPDGTRYYYRARAINSLGNSTYTTAVAGITPLTEPDEFYITSTSPTAIMMEWRDNAANETAYAIERSTTSGSGFTQIGTTSANATTYTDTTVSNGTRYYYRVRATNAVAQSDYAAEVTALASAYQPAEFYEPFSHSLSPATLIGRPGSGSGVSGNYALDSGFQAGERIYAGNIEAGRIPGLGNRLQLPGVNGTANNAAGVQATLTPAVRSIINPPANGSRTFWVSCSYRTASSLDPNRGISLILGAMNVRLGHDGKYELPGPFFSYTSPPNSIAPNTSYFVLVKTTLTDTNANAVDGSEQRETRLWIYPANTLPPLAEPATGGLLVPNGPNFGNNSVLVQTLNVWGADSALGQSIDEIRIASTYAQVALPPPPVPAAPIVTAAQSATGTIGNAFAYDVLTSNSPTSYALASGSLPPGVNLDTATGRLSGTPPTAGIFTPSFTATNGVGTSPAVSMTITISDPALIVYDGFNYTLASTNPDPDANSNGGHGLPAANIGGNPSGTSTGLRGNYGTDQTVVTGLSYSDVNGVLATSGNALQRNTGTSFSASAAAIYRLMTADPFATLRSTASSNYLGWNGTSPTTLFFSVLLNVNALNTGSDNRLVVNLGTDNSSWNIYLGQFTGTSQWRYGDQAGTSAVLGSAIANQPALIVGRLSFNSATQFVTDFWFNPPLGQTLSTPTFTKTYTTTTFGGQFRAIQTRDGANVLTVDEFRLGTSFFSVTPLAVPPSAPSGLTATSSSDSQVTLNWFDNATDETGFKLERSPDGSTGWTQIATPTANATSAADTGLLSGTTYYYRLRSTNTNGNSAYSNTASATTFSGLQSFRSTHGLASDGSQDLLKPAGDGVTNLLKYAFNMLGSGTGQVSSLQSFNSQTLSPSGSAGLPFGFLEPPSGKLHITFIRRKASSNPGITYTVEFSDALATWATNPSATESVTSLDAIFERVTVTDSTLFTKRFARVKVTAP